MTNFLRLAVAAATAATVALAPFSVAHASSFGGSSNGSAAVVDKPQPTEPQPSQPGQTVEQIDREVSETLRKKFRDALNKAGHTENADATGKAEELVQRALAGEFTLTHRGNGVYAWEGPLIEDGYYYGLVMRMPKAETTFGVQVMDQFEMESQEHAYPYGVATDFNDDYHFLAVVLKPF